MFEQRTIDRTAEVEQALRKAVERKRLTLDDVETLLFIRDPRDIEELFIAARAAKERKFGKAVFCYGFVYFSTHCRNDCSFCFYRRSNKESVRYRKTEEDIIALASDLEDDGVHLVDLTMGEDPLLRNGGGHSKLVDIVQRVDDTVEVPLMVSPGVMPRESFQQLRGAGADWFACYQETHNRELFERLRPHQDFDERLLQKKWALGEGMLAEEGIMIGVGEKVEDRARSIQIMGDLGVQQVRAMSFIPQQGHQDVHPSTFIDELITIAVMRLAYPDKLIPASLDIEGLNGLRSRLEAGANVITSIIPPQKGLAGVAQHELDIECGGRTVGQVTEVLDDLGMRMASPYSYRYLIENWKRPAVARGG